jgi:multidrug efflux pump subunit AcrA (membrane-fusion protein)
MVGAALLGGCEARATVVDVQTPAVSVTRASAPAVQAIFSGPASVVSVHTYRLAFEVSGRVARVNANVGDRVSAGAVLATLTDADYRAALAAASARATVARAQADKTLAGARPQEKVGARGSVDMARAQLADAQSALTLARANATRSRNLYVEGAIAAQSDDAARAGLAAAQARVDAAAAALVSAQSQSSLIDSGARSEDRLAANATASEADAARDEAALTLRKTVLVAPAPAYVLARNIETGDEAAPGGVVFTLTDAAPPDAVIAVPEARSAAISVGTPAVLIAGGRSYRARVTQVEPEADAVTRTVQVRLHAANFSLRPGSVIIARIGTHPVAGASVPMSALLTAADGATSISIVDPIRRTVRRQPVHVQALRGDSVVVTGVRPGELIVTGGQYPVQPGERVTIVPQSA